METNIKSAKIIEQPMGTMVEVDKIVPAVSEKTIKVRYTKTQLEKMVEDGEMAKLLLEKLQ